YARTRHAWHLRLPPPRVAVVYFFEGNDLNNNMTFLQRRVQQPDAPDLADRIDRALAAYPAAFYVDHADWRQPFPLLPFPVRLAQRLYAERTISLRTPEPDDIPRLDAPNAVEVAGHTVDLPSNLQSPALELTQAEIDRSALVFERSLAFLQKLLPGTPVLIA